jgi:hypothetical protein
VAEGDGFITAVTVEEDTGGKHAVDAVHDRFLRMHLVHDEFLLGREAAQNFGRGMPSRRKIDEYRSRAHRTEVLQRVGE